MAAIGKIRSWGPVLVTVIGLALFAFIAEELFRSCEATNNEQRQQVGQVLGKKISVQEFQSLVDEYQEVMKYQRQLQGRDYNLSEEELNSLKDQVWQTFVVNTVIADEAKKIGLTVTDEEMQNMLREGTNPMLASTPFRNQQTGRFDVMILSQFLDRYNTALSQGGQELEQMQPVYRYWQFIEKTLREQTLAMKYQTLVYGSLLSNPVSAEASFNDQNTESSIILASMPYGSINDNDVKIEDADLKAKYNEKKEQFKDDIETRDIKYVVYQVKASDKDRDDLLTTMKLASDTLAQGAAPAEIVRKAQSLVAYQGLPVTKKALPRDIAGRLDSMSVGETSAPFETKSDNTLNVVKFLAKSQMPDSVEFRAIQIPGQTIEAVRLTADSVMTALKSGVAFDSIARKYGQNAEKSWLTSDMYENAPVLDADSKSYIAAITTMATNELKNLEMTQGNLIIQVTDRRNMVDKYDVAIVKRTIDFSKETYSDAYNKFSQFVSSNRSVDAIEKNCAEFGYQALDRAKLRNSEHNVAGVRATREAMKWIFDAKEGDVSPLYECGDNDRLMVVAVTKVHPKGYEDWESVKEELTQEVMADKKFNMLSEKLAGVKTIADAQKQGAVVDTVRQITFSAPVFVQTTGAREPALSGAVCATEKGKFSKSVVKGNRGAYVFEVIDQTKREGVVFDAKKEEEKLQQQAMQAVSRFIQDLVQNAEIVDNRYLFF